MPSASNCSCSRFARCTTTWLGALRGSAALAHRERQPDRAEGISGPRRATTADAKHRSLGGANLARVAQQQSQAVGAGAFGVLDQFVGAVDDRRWLRDL